MTAFTRRAGQLFAENVSIDDIARTYGTPVYCYSATQIADNVHLWQRALSNVLPHDRFTICYACKANDNLGIMRLMATLGTGVDVVSGGELRRAQLAGIPADKTVFSGVGKTADELADAIKCGIMQINVESLPELEQLSAIAVQMGTRINIALRVNPDVDAKTHAKIATGLRGHKFGVDIANAQAIYKKAAQMPGIIPSGVAIHIGSQLMSLDPYREAFTHLAALVRTLRDDGIDIKTTDLGGGLGIPYDDETAPDINAYAALVRDIIAPLNTHIVVEPGRALVGDAGILITRVIYRKDATDGGFVILDAGMNDLIRPALYDATHQVVPAHIDDNTPTDTFDIVGPVCETADTFLTSALLPATVAAGDVMAIMTAGAYGASMSSTYNTRPLVAEILVKDDATFPLRPRQTIDDLIAADTVPEFLA